MPASTLRVTPSGYEPASAFDQEVHAQYALGSFVEADLHQNKSNDQLKLYWGFLAFVVQHTDRFGDRYGLSNALLTEAGYVRNFNTLIGGGIHTAPMFISEMDHPTFNTFTKRAFIRIWEEFGIDVDHYKAHLRRREF